MNVIRVVPERQINPDHRSFIPGLAEHVRGGVYLHQGEDITGWTVASTTISVGIGGPPSFVFDYLTDQPEPASGHFKVKANLFRRSAGWCWERSTLILDPDTADRIEALVSVEAKGKHHYALRADFDCLHLERYPEAKSEPRLRPTTYAMHITQGSICGAILVRGRRHPVYSTLRAYDDRF